MRSNCKRCSKNFYVKPANFNLGFGIYCSHACQYADKKKRTILKCGTCGKEIARTPSVLAKSKSKKFFCTKSCQTVWRNQYYIAEKHANWKTGRSSYQSVLDRHGVPRVCQNCGITDSRVLVTHHRDQNRTNNELSNLARICHNCHHLVHNRPNYKPKNMVPLV